MEELQVRDGLDCWVSGFGQLECALVLALTTSLEGFVQFRGKISLFAGKTSLFAAACLHGVFPVPTFVDLTAPLLSFAAASARASRRRRTVSKRHQRQLNATLSYLPADRGPLQPIPTSKMF